MAPPHRHRLWAEKVQNDSFLTQQLQLMSVKQGAAGGRREMSCLNGELCWLCGRVTQQSVLQAAPHPSPHQVSHHHHHPYSSITGGTHVLSSSGSLLPVAWLTWGAVSLSSHLSGSGWSWGEGKKTIHVQLKIISFLKVWPNRWLNFFFF